MTGDELHVEPPATVRLEGVTYYKRPGHPTWQIIAISFLVALVIASGAAWWVSRDNDRKIESNVVVNCLGIEDVKRGARGLVDGVSAFVADNYPADDPRTLKFLDVLETRRKAFRSSNCPEAP